MLHHSHSLCAGWCAAQALSKLAPHIQQVSMESNGKGVDLNGKPLPYGSGEVGLACMAAWRPRCTHCVHLVRG